jgi:hypothetical protein
LLLAQLLVASTADAKTYTVKSAGGGSYTTIGGCAAVAAAGDTCLIYAGTYDETVTPKSSGSSGSPITYSTNPGDSVTVTGWNLGTLAYLTITGTASHPMTITQQIAWSAIQHCVFQYISNSGGTGSDSCFKGTPDKSAGASSDNQFLDNTLSYCAGAGAGLAAGITIEGHNNLFDGNTFSHVQSAIQLYGSFNVVRNNTFGPVAGADLGGQHSQPIESSGDCSGAPGDYPLVHMLFENNTSTQWRGPDSHAGFLLRDTSTPPCGQTSNVIRLSSFMDSGSYLTVTQTHSLNEYFYNISVSNTQLDNSPKDQEDYSFTDDCPNSRTLNNIFANTTRVGSEDWGIYIDGTSAPYVENHNLFFSQGWTGSWYGPTSASTTTYDGSDLFNEDPRFVDPNTKLQLQPGSPAIAAGGPLTTTVGSGTSSTSLAVSDAGFFSWGYGIPNVQGDWIRIGASTTAQISTIDYSTNVITLAGAVSWSKGDGVYLYKDSNGNPQLGGPNPNIGAFTGGASSSGDAGPGADGGTVDSGPPGDAGPQPDGGHTPDGGLKTDGGHAADGGSIADGGTDGGGRAGNPATGCGCSTPGSPRSALFGGTASIAMVSFILAMTRRRRPRRCPQPRRPHQHPPGS